MKREVVKGITMLTTIVAVALAMAVVSANAQSKMVVSNVPFEFVVGDATLPAGEYRISRGPGIALAIQSRDTRDSALRLTHDIQPGKSRQPARLVFHRYGQRYFLVEVWRGSDSMGWQLLKSRQERAIKRENSAIAAGTKHVESGYAIVQVAAVLQ